MIKGDTVKTVYGSGIVERVNKVSLTVRFQRQSDDGPWSFIKTIANRQIEIMN